jgi:hydroxysqualene dehydroxylase
MPLSRLSTPSIFNRQTGLKTKAAARSVAVIGAGWAGCAAAVELAQRGHRPILFESARTLGGRARHVRVDGRNLDNGQHILLGAYAETLRLMRIAGLDPAKVLLRLPLQLCYPATGGMEFIAPRLPAPLHVLTALLRARGLKRQDKLALARFPTTARWMDWKLNTDCTVAELLDRFDQTDNLVRLMWRPLCIAALNTPIERASAQVFLNVLRDSLGARRAASDMLVPRVDLTSLFPQYAAEFIERRGGAVVSGAAVKALRPVGQRWEVDTGNDSGAPDHGGFDAVIVATQPAQAAFLLEGLAAPAGLKELEYEPITTCFLQYGKTARLPRPFLALLDRPETRDWGQFVFDRGQLDPAHAGLLAVVVSASTEALADGHDALAADLARQLAQAFASPDLARPAWVKVISEKRATFSCTPALARPANETSLPSLYLAGDYTAGDYPATLESAVRSGVRAARLIIG